MFDISVIKIDPQKATKGTWVPWMGGSKLLLARYNNRRAESARAEVSMEIFSLLQKTEDPEELERIEKLERERLAEVLSEYVLLGWEGISDGGKEIKYSKETALELLKNPELEDFYQAVVNLSLSYDNFRVQAEEEVKEDVKNS